jgi:hypothetical protein
VTREAKEPIKKHIYAAGAKDPRKLFVESKRSMHIGMDMGSTDGPFYHPNRDLRRKIVEQVRCPEDAGLFQGSPTMSGSCDPIASRWESLWTWSFI